MSPLRQSRKGDFFALFPHGTKPYNENIANRNQFGVTVIPAKAGIQKFDFVVSTNYFKKRIAESQVIKRLLRTTNYEL